MYLDGVVLCEGQVAAGGAEVGRACDSTPPLAERQFAIRPSSDNMCSGAEGGAAWPLKESAPAAANALDHYRLQLYNYAVAERLRLYQPTVPACYAPYGPRLALSMSLLHHRAFHPEEPKPQHSYIGLIAMAILSSPEGKLVLSDIYQHILDNYPYFRTRGPGWRNSIRHNLSLNDCFVKAGRSANGKGHYWAVHPANVDDFRKGDFRRRKAQRKVRKHMGLAVDDDGEDSPSPPPQSPPPTALPVLPFWGAGRLPTSAVARKRQFDVASLLAPDDAPEKRFRRESSCEEEAEEDIDVVASDQEERGSETGSGGERSGAGEPCGLLGGWWPTLEPALLHQLRRHAAAAAAVPHHAERPPDT